VDERQVAERIETFVRQTFDVAPDDPRFGRETDLFESGYVDSVGLTELLAFIEAEFEIEVPDEDLASDLFLTIDGMAAIVTRLAGP
jgi:acyl carrier protein